MEIQKKRKISFKPASDIKAMLMEVENLIFLLGKNVSIEDVINSALRHYLPEIILNLKNELYSQKRFMNILNEIENSIKDNLENLKHKDENNENIEQEEEEENITEIFNPEEIQNRLVF